MDIKLVVMSTTEKNGSHGLVHSSARFRKLLMVPSSGGDGDIYGYYHRSKAQEALSVTHNSVPATDDTLVEEGVGQRR